MGTTKGRLEGLITVPTGGWDASVTDGTGNATVTLAAGDYFLSSAAPSGASSLIAALENAINAAMTDTFVVTFDGGESGTGAITITNSSANATAITWTDTELRDLLGFETDGDLSLSTAYTSSGQCRACWLSPHIPRTLNTTQWRRSDFRTSAAPNGAVYSFQSNEYDAFDLAWDTVPRARAWLDNEIRDGESWERFWTGHVWGTHPWAQAGSMLRWYLDADEDGTHSTYRYAGQESDFRLEQTRTNYAGLWRIDVTPLYQVPGTLHVVAPVGVSVVAGCVEVVASGAGENQVNGPLASYTFTGIDPTRGDLLLIGRIVPDTATGAEYSIRPNGVAETTETAGYEEDAGAGGAQPATDSWGSYMRIAQNTGLPAASNVMHVRYEIGTRVGVARPYYGLSFSREGGSVAGGDASSKMIGGTWAETVDAFASLEVRGRSTANLGVGTKLCLIYVDAVP